MPLVIFMGLIMVFVMYFFRRESRAAAGHLDPQGFARAVGKLDPDERQVFLFAAGPMLGKPADRTRLLEYRNGEVVIQRLDGSDPVRGSLRGVTTRWSNYATLLTIVLEVWSPTGPVVRTFAGHASYPVASRISKLKVHK